MLLGREDWEGADGFCGWVDIVGGGDARGEGEVEVVSHGFCGGGGVGGLVAIVAGHGLGGIASWDRWGWRAVRGGIDCCVGWRGARLG